MKNKYVITFETELDEEVSAEDVAARLVEMAFHEFSHVTYVTNTTTGDRYVAPKGEKVVS